MIVERGSLTIKTTRRFEVIDVTQDVGSWVESLGVGNGLLLAYVPHTTAAIVVNEGEPRLMEDIIQFLRDLTKPGAQWKHNMIDVNAHAHLGNIILGDSRVIPVTGGKLSLGTWQRLLFIEMDGPRERTLQLVFIGQ